MLDLAGILFSSIMMFIVIVRAVQLDRTKPWFEGVKAKVQTVAETSKIRSRIVRNREAGGSGGR